MSGQPKLTQAKPSFSDSAFGPRSAFDFDEDVSNLGDNMTAFDAFPGEELDFSLVDGEYEGDEELGQRFFNERAGPFEQSQRTTNASQGFGFGMHPGMSEPRSAQSNIVSSRSGQVSQQFGQITPPNDDPSQNIKMASKPSPTRTQENGKLSNEQRARNAANTRHSRSKHARRKSEQNEDGLEDESSQKQGKNITVQREKNRVAAAKCRAKKKTANEHQEEMANDYSATNNYLTREIRELKNQKTEFQNLLLAHRPGVCECHGIHEYNFGQAQRLVFNARRQIAEPLSSPSRESAFSGQSPVSEESAIFSAPPHTRHQSFNGALNYPFASSTNLEAMRPIPSATRKGHSMSTDFADFLHSSPGGRAGFS